MQVTLSPQKTRTFEWECIKKRSYSSNLLWVSVEVVPEWKQAVRHAGSVRHTAGMYVGKQVTGNRGRGGAGSSDTDRQVEGVTAQWCCERMGTNEQADLLAGQVIYTMYEVTVSSVDAVRFLWVVAAPCMTYTWRRVGGSHWDKHMKRASWLWTQ